MIQVQTNNLSGFVPETYFADQTAALNQAQTWLQEATGAGNDFVGWVHLPKDYDKEEFSRIKAAAKKIQKQSTALVVIGIGGSYLGARGVIEALCSPNYNQLKKDTPNLYFAGNTLSVDALNEIVALIGDQDFSINVISKSGTTTEPAVAFRFFKALCEKKYGKEGAKERIYATTDKARGALKSLADAEGYETFVVPDDVGGRYSVLTAVGLLPIAACGVDIDALMAGAAKMMDLCATGGAQNPAWWSDTMTQYGVLHKLLIDRKGCYIDGVRTSEQTLDSLEMFSGDCFLFRIGVKADAEYVGGINLFGEHFGNTSQHINVKVNYIPASP